MKCPNCGDPDAYVGLREVDCPNPACRLFKGNERKTDRKAVTCCGFCHKVGHTISDCPERYA